MRFKPSNGLDGNYIYNASPLSPANGFQSHQTERDPSKFAYSNNLFKNDYWELRTRGGDYLYQIYSRLYRSNDGWTRTLAAYTGFTFMMFNQALIWKIHFFFFLATTLARVRDRGAEPTVDEIWMLDQLFASEKLNKYFKPESYHVIDYEQQWDTEKSAYFPEYKTPVAKFFNVDCNTSTGFFKMGDVATGAMMTLHFKTMPYSNCKYAFTEPFLVYDMYAEVSHKGEYFVEHLIKAEETLKTKRIFVTWH